MKVSIIMPVYNVEKYIAKSIESVLKQTYTNFELLIIIDGSPDNSKQIAETFEDSRITIYEKPNGGLSDARNFGLNKANGDYIYFIDSDDWIEPNLLESTVKFFERDDVNVIIFGYFLDNENLNKKLLSAQKIESENIEFVKGKDDFSLDENRINLLGYAWNKIYRTKFLRDHNIIFDKGVSLVEDILFNSKVYKSVDRLIFINDTLYHYINRPSESLIKTFHTNSFELYLKKATSMELFLNSWKISVENKNTILATVIVSGIRYCINNLFAFKNNLSEKEKLDYIKMIINHSETQKYIRYYKAVSIYDKLYKTMISAQTSLLLYLLCKIKK